MERVTSHLRLENAPISNTALRVRSALKVQPKVAILAAYNHKGEISCQNSLVLVTPTCQIDPLNKRVIFSCQRMHVSPKHCCR